jgi:hypothetical protein
MEGAHNVIAHDGAPVSEMGTKVRTMRVEHPSSSLLVAEQH